MPMYDYQCLDCGKESLIVVTLKEHERGEGGEELTMQNVPFLPPSRTGRLLIGLLGGLALLSLDRPSLYAQEYPPDTARGKAVYERHCQSCHGVTGYGDGPAAPSLRVAPTNFQQFRSFLKSDDEVLRTIEHGVVFSPMHAWRGQLTDGEMQDVVAYIRLLSQQGR